MPIGTPVNARDGGSGVSIGAASSGAITVTAAAGAHVFIAVGGPTSTSRTVSTVTGGGLTWTVAEAITSTTAFCEIWSAPNPSGITSQSITVTFSGAVLAAALVALSATGTAGTLDGTGNGATEADASATWNPGSAVTSNANDLIVAAGMSDSSGPNSQSSVSGSGTELIDFSSANDIFMAVNYRIVSSSGSYSIGGTPANNPTGPGAYVIAAFTEGAAAVGISRARKAMMLC